MVRRALTVTVCLLLALPGAMPALAQSGEFAGSEALREAVTAQGLVRHLEALDAIADRHDETRVSGTPGYDASVAYVISRLRGAGYDVDKQRFAYDFFDVLSPPVLEQVNPKQVTYEEGVDFATMDYSGSGDVTAEVVAVDLTLPPTPETSSTSGCELEDFPTEVVGNIALIQRGTCLFGDKANNAEAAGAAGVIMFNEGNPTDPTRVELLLGTLEPPVAEVPVVGTTFSLGAVLANGVSSGPTGGTVHLQTHTIAERRPTYNVIAETPTGNARNVVMAGAHLDSVGDGPGINDNGSGIAGVLEVALQLARLDIDIRNKVRFAFWGAEESGLIGSTRYVENLSRTQLLNIDLYLNFDMIGSTNFVRFVYDGNGSAFGIRGPRGSAALERTFAAYFRDAGLPSSETPFDGRSDYQAFINAGIPAGGLFTGAEGKKTEEEEATYGGQAGVAYDSCYHEFCDQLGNVDRNVLHEMADAISHAVYRYSQETSSLN
jgi:Zn-dependent M28 family amino/carboxypeptidase